MSASRHRRLRWVWSVAAGPPAVALLLAGLIGCAGAPTSPAQAPPSAPSPTAVGDGATAILSDGTTALVGDRTSGTTTATQVRGRLLTFRGGCALLGDGTGSLSLLVLEPGTTTTPDSSGFITPDGVVLRDGDGIAAVGVIAGMEDSGARQAWPSAPEECFGVGQVARVVADLRRDDSVIDEQLAAFGHREQYDDGTLLLAPQRPPLSGADARIAGELTRLPGGCLGLIDPMGSRQLVKWPFGSVWEPQQQALVLPEQGAVRLGQEVVLGGGQGLAEWLKPALPTECVYDHFWTAN